MKMRFLIKIDIIFFQVGTFSGGQNKKSILLLRGVAFFERQKNFFNTLSVLRTFFMIFTKFQLFQHLKRFKYIFWTDVGVISWCLSCVCALLLALLLYFACSHGPLSSSSRRPSVNFALAIGRAWLD